MVTCLFRRLFWSWWGFELFIVVIGMSAKLINIHLCVVFIVCICIVLNNQLTAEHEWNEIKWKGSCDSCATCRRLLCNVHNEASHGRFRIEYSVQLSLREHVLSSGSDAPAGMISPSEPRSAAVIFSLSLLIIWEIVFVLLSENSFLI